MTKVLAITDIKESDFFKKWGRLGFAWELRPIRMISFQNSNHFDVILLDCDNNLTEIDLIFDDFNFKKYSTPIIISINDLAFQNDVFCHIPVESFILNSNSEELLFRINHCVALSKRIKNQNNSLQLSNEISSSTKTPNEDDINASNNASFIAKGLSYSDSGYEILANGEPINLSYKEFELLNFLINNKDRVFSREEIINELWEDEQLLTRSIDVHIRRIRSKLGHFSKHLQSIRSRGYFWTLRV